MKSAIVIRELEEDFEVVELRTTTLEASLYPFPFRSEDPYRAQTAPFLGHLFEEAIMSGIISEEAGELMEDYQSMRMSSMDWLTENSSKDVSFLKYKFDNHFVTKIARHYYSEGVVSAQNALCLPIHCGKYLVFLTGTSDLLFDDFSVRDVKYYSSKFGDKDDIERDVYTLDNYRNSKLSSKMQWYVYPLLYGFDRDIVSEVKFCYDLYSKAKNAPSANNPDKYLDRTVYECSVNLDKAREQLEKDIIKYFRLCDESNTVPGNKVEFTSN